MDDQERRLERIADIQGTDRLANEHVASFKPDDGSNQTFRCECGNPICHDTVVLGRDVYEVVREDPMLFIVWPGHELPEAEVVVDTGLTYEIVRKNEELRTVLERTDLRNSESAGL